MPFNSDGRVRFHYCKEQEIILKAPLKVGTEWFLGFYKEENWDIIFKDRENSFIKALVLKKSTFVFHSMKEKWG